MYQIASTIGIAVKNNCEFIFPKWKYSEFFENPIPQLAYSSPIVEKVVNEGVNFNYQDIVINDKNRIIDAVGYWQSYKYFKDCDVMIKRYFTFKDSIRRKVKIENKENACSIHVRRGDYVNLEKYHPLASMAYYSKAIEKVKTKYDNNDIKFYIMSDDIEWCKENFKGYEFTFCEGSTEVDDMCRMTLCQPVGTMVKTIDGDIPIEDIKPSMRVVSYAQNHLSKSAPGNIIGVGDRILINKNNGRAVLKTSNRFFDGNLVVVSTGDKKTKYTPNHHCVVKMGDVFYNKSIVYLMRKGNKFRVGVTNPTSHNYQRKNKRVIGNSDPRRIFRNEKGDACWVLATFDNKYDALIEEGFISSKFGIPQIEFVMKGLKKEEEKNRIKIFWERFGDNLENGVNCLKYYNRELEYPMFDKKRVTLDDDREIIFNACNLLSGMKVLDYDKFLKSDNITDKIDAWDEINVNYEKYRGLVYSLKVDINETYIADGIVTHNCDYHIIANSSFSWWGAYLADSKLVIYPDKWFGDAYAEMTKDRFPEGWVKL